MELTLSASSTHCLVEMIWSLSFFFRDFGNDGGGLLLAVLMPLGLFHPLVEAGSLAPPLQHHHRRLQQLHCAQLYSRNCHHHHHSQLQPPHHLTTAVTSLYSMCSIFWQIFKRNMLLFTSSHLFPSLTQHRTRKCDSAILHKVCLCKVQVCNSREPGCTQSSACNCFPGALTTSHSAKI